MILVKRERHQIIYMASGMRGMGVRHITEIHRDPAKSAISGMLISAGFAVDSRRQRRVQMKRK